MSVLQHQEQTNYIFYLSWPLNVEDFCGDSYEKLRYVCAAFYMNLDVIFRSALSIGKFENSRTQS